MDRPVDSWLFLSTVFIRVRWVSFFFNRKGDIYFQIRPNKKRKVDEVIILDDDEDSDDVSDDDLSSDNTFESGDEEYDVMDSFDRFVPYLYITLTVA